MAILDSSSIRRPKMPAQPQHVLTERTLLTADGQAVPSGHPDGVQLLGGKGQAIPYGVAVATGLIAVAAAGAYPKHAGGGWYELSDGSRVKGKEDALVAEKALAAGGDKELAAGADKGADA